ncbi:MAG: LapA family protein [Hyphomicrobiales bacterium]
MLRLISYLVTIPLAILLIALAVANRGPITLSLDPMSPDAPALTVTLPIYLVLFATLGIGIFIGGVATWFRQGKWRKVARERRFEVAKWRREADHFRATAKKAEAGNANTPALAAPGAERPAA